MQRHEENISNDERRVADLIGTLKHVEVPGDFEARVRSRIAAKRSASPRHPWIQVLAGAGAVAVVIVAVLFGLRSFAPQEAPSVVEIMTSQPGSIGNRATSVPDLPAAPQPVADNPVVAPDRRASAEKPARPSNSGGGSIEFSSRPGRTFYPRGVDPNTVKPGEAVTPQVEIPVLTILGGLGINATWNGSGWRVDEVATGNVADRSGVRTGDVIEAIDGKALTEKTSFRGTFSGKSLRLSRDGQVVDVPFKP